MLLFYVASHYLVQVINWLPTWYRAPDFTDFPNSPTDPSNPEVALPCLTEGPELQWPFKSEQLNSQLDVVPWLGA